MSALTSINPRRDHVALNLIGLAGIAFFAIYVDRRVQDGEPFSALWACHLASLLAGTGILLRRPSLIGIGVLWLCVGIPLWAAYLAIGEPFRPTSALTHFGGLAVGLYGVRAFGMPRGLWWKAILGLWVLFAISRWGPPELNVNLAFHVYQPREYFRGFHAVALFVFSLGATLLFIVVERELCAVAPAGGARDTRIA